jgi:O-antigen ligase
MKFAQLSILITLVCIPFYIIRSFVVVPGINFYVPFTLLEVLILFTTLITSMTFFKGGYSFDSLKTKFDWLILLFLIAGLVAVYTSYDFIGGLGIFKAYFIEPVLFFYCLTFVGRLKGYSFIIWGLLGSGIWLSALAFLQKFFGIFIFAPIEYDQGRITGVFNSGNSLALFLGPVAVLAFSRFFTIGYKKYSKYLYLLLFVVFLLVIIYSRSRGGLISLVGALSVFSYALLTIKSDFFRKIWYLVPAVVLICLSTFFVYFYQNYDFFHIDYSRPYTDGDTLQIRYFIWSGTVNLLKDHFIFGAGLNGFKTLYSNQYRPVQYQEQFQYPHNILLTFWTEVGLLGLFSFLLLVVSMYGTLIRNLVKSKQPIFGAALLSILSYWMLHGMVDVPYFKNDLSLVFWVVTALVVLWGAKKVNI